MLLPVAGLPVVGLPVAGRIVVGELVIVVALVSRWAGLLLILLLVACAGLRRRSRVVPALPPLELDSAGSDVGVVADGPNWTSVLRVEGADANLEELIRVLAGTRAERAQLVRWTVPTPAGGAWHVHWIALRGNTLATASTAALRLVSILAAQGFAARPLREPELLNEVRSSLAAGDSVARESWSAWTLGTLHHATFRVNEPPGEPADLARVMRWYAGRPALSTCVSLCFESGEHPRMLVRIAVAGGRKPRAALRRALGKLAQRSRPMNGRQAEGVLATLPLAR